MKLTDFLYGIGRPVAYYPNLKKITGSTTATILLCQFVYWRGKESDPDGWLYKTSIEIEEETGLTYDEQRTARKKLVENGLIEEHYARLDHQLRFRINLDVMNEKWGSIEVPDGEMGISQMGNKALPNSLNESENTTENKPKAKTIEEAIFSGQPVTEDMLDNGKEQALIEFEASFGFGTLPWNSNSTWDKFAKFVQKYATIDPGWPADYVAWRQDGGKYRAFSNRKIRENPQAFMDTGYPEYDACKMYREDDKRHAL